MEVTERSLLREMDAGIKHILLIGSAGSGKTHLIRRFVSMTNRNILTVAPTGQAASYFGGSTIHAAFGFLPSLILPNEVNLINTLNEIDIILIDEISMVRCDVLDGIDLAMQKAKDNSKVFGGAKIILIGDPYQLGPVITTDNEEYYPQIAKEYSKPYYFFYSKALGRIMADGTINIFRLMNNFRYRLNSPFGSILEEMRIGQCRQESIDALNTCCKHINPNTLLTSTVLATTNEIASSYNKAALNHLLGKEYVYTPSIEYTKWYNGEYFDTNQHTTPLHIKEGCEIICTKNMTYHGLINGDRAKIVKIEEENGDKPSAVWISVYKNGELTKPYRIRPTITYVMVPRYIDRIKRIKTVALVAITHFPFILAYGLTVHRAQGMTLDSVLFDKGSGVFASGQLYTAVSRLRSLSGLTLINPLDESDIKTEPAVREFMNSLVITDVYFTKKRQSPMKKTAFTELTPPCSSA